MADQLSLRDQRELALRAQGLAGSRLKDVPGLLEHIGAVQLDTISVLARSHLLVPWSRLGALPAGVIETAYWPHDRPATFEYWAHAACILPIDRWPAFGFRRRARLERGRRWHRLEEPEATLALVRDRLASDGPLTAFDLGGAKRGGPWWDWSETKIALEWLLDTGEVVCVERRGWRRVYDLATRAVPAHLLGQEWDDARCVRALVADSLNALGAPTARELARHYALPAGAVRQAVHELELIEVRLEGSRLPGYVLPDALGSLSSRARVRPSLLSPFDSLLWDRDRVERLFGFVHRLEAYVPAARRVHGYYAMPVLSGSGLVGRVDPGRAKGRLLAKHVVVASPSAIPAIADALLGAASWVTADQIEIHRVTPAGLRPVLTAALEAKAPGILARTS